MPYNMEGNKNIAARILGGGLLLVAAGLFALQPDDSPRGARVRESRAAPAIVNATSSDGPTEAKGPDEARWQEDLRNLEKKIRMLEADVAALKRRNRIPEQ
jgi:hypothetical protein